MVKEAFDLNKRQKAIYLTILLSGRDWSVDDLQAIIECRSKNWRTSVNAVARSICLKTASWDKPLVRKTLLGRGRKAVYGIGEKR